ncbi:Uncharacterised protein [Escherichia coli]|nr:hypothetical protein [Escherichia coli]CAD5874821.1 Uncharacterised protein [Escherichia coli]
MQDWFVSWLYDDGMGDRLEGWNIFTVSSSKAPKQVAVDFIKETAREIRRSEGRIVLKSFNRV